MPFNLKVFASGRTSVRWSAKTLDTLGREPRWDKVRKGLAPGALVVELNQQIIKQEQWPEIQLKAGDRLELLSFVGGG